LHRIAARPQCPGPVERQISTGIAVLSTKPIEGDSGLFLSRLTGLFKRRKVPTPAQLLHRLIVEQARQPGFYTALHVPDTLDGRFELIALHCFLVVHRLKAEPAGVELARQIVETMFADLDASLREMGAGDLGVGKRIKKMGQGFYGRVAAYDAGLADLTALEAALRRNLYGTVEALPDAVVSMVAAYAMKCSHMLEKQSISDVSSGFLAFPPIPAGPPPAPARH
jgi:cytochrome b pre-mRNA-processing protein 3